MSGAVHLWRELIEARADHRTGEILERHGVADPDVQIHCGLAKIRTAGRFYEYDVDGEYAIIVPILDGDEFVDHLAFDPRQPEKWWLRLGSPHFLGGDNIFCWSAPISVWRTPLGYLQAGLEGVVVLDWNGALPIFGTLREIIVEDMDHGIEIRDRLSLPSQLPQISVLKMVAA